MPGTLISLRLPAPRHTLHLFLLNAFWDQIAEAVGIAMETAHEYRLKMRTFDTGGGEGAGCVQSIDVVPSTMEANKADELMWGPEELRAHSGTMTSHRQVQWEHSKATPRARALHIAACRSMTLRCQDNPHVAVLPWHPTHNFRENCFKTSSGKFEFTWLRRCIWCAELSDTLNTKKSTITLAWTNIHTSWRSMLFFFFNSSRILNAFY